MVEQLNHESNIPLHLQAENILRSLIASGQYDDGKLLPKEVELAEQLNISRSTLRQAIHRLVFEGVLLRKRRFGTVVAPKAMHSNARNWLSFSQEMQNQGFTAGNFELHIARKTPPSNNISAFFGIGKEQKLLTIERLRGTEDNPFVYFISYFNPSIGLTGNENFSRPLYEILEKDFGVVVETSREEISAQGALPQIAEKLDIKEGDPVLVRKRLVYDNHDLPTEYNIGYYKADSFTYTLEFKR
jgi:GntR family transcriptional regulator